MDIIKRYINKIIGEGYLRKYLNVKINNILFYSKSLVYAKNIRRSKKRDIFSDYEYIVNIEKQLCKEAYIFNDFYGIATQIKLYSGYKKSIKACIEHGVYFGNYTDKKEYKNSGLPAVITLSNQRYKHLRKVTDKPIFTIGPYIHYCDGIYDEREINNIKSKLGKTLLVFPVHSVDKVKAEYDIDSFINDIRKFRNSKRFDNVIVCLYWKDIQLGRHKKYIEEGFKITTAGHRSSKLFLRRLKTIINLADYTLSNSVGTHIGYCIYMNKPHIIINQKTSYSGDTEKDLKKEFDRGENYEYYSKLEKGEIIEAFKEYKTEISKEQLSIVDKYWGINEIKSKDEIREILLFCQYVFTESSKIDNEFINNAKNEINKNKYSNNIIKSMND